MFAMPVVPIYETAGAANAAAASARRTPVVVGVCLFLLLVFSTVTVFVRDAWALESFQIGIFALLAAYLLEKALYELLYELNNRPAWLRITLAGILTL